MMKEEEEEGVSFPPLFKKKKKKKKKKKLRFRLPASPHSELVPFGSSSRDKLTCVAFYTAESESR